MFMNWRNDAQTSGLHETQAFKTAVPNGSISNPRPVASDTACFSTGSSNAPVTGILLIRVTSDDGAEVLLHGKPLCGEDGIHGDRGSSGTVRSKLGAHPLRIRYFQGVGGESLRLEWVVPDGQMEEILHRPFVIHGTVLPVEPTTMFLKNRGEHPLASERKIL